MTTCEAVRIKSADVELIEHHLAQEISAQEDVLRRVGEHERLLVKNDVDGLKRFLAESDPILARLQTLTELRLRIMSLFAKRLGMPLESCSVRTVLGCMDDADRTRVGASADRLSGLLKEVDRRSRRVNVLLKHASETNQALLHALLGASAPPRLYRPDGQRASAPGLSHFTRDF